MAEGYTDGDGVAVFTIEDGTYLVTSSKLGFETKQMEISISADMILEIILEPTPPEKYTLTVKIVDTEGNPISNVRVVVV